MSRLIRVDLPAPLGPIMEVSNPTLKGEIQILGRNHHAESLIQLADVQQESQSY